MPPTPEKQRSMEKIEIVNPRDIEGYLSRFNGSYMGTMGVLLSQGVEVEDAHDHALGSCRLVEELDENDPSTGKGEIKDRGIEYQSQSGKKYSLIYNGTSWEFKFPKDSSLSETFKEVKDTFARQREEEEARLKERISGTKLRKRK